MSFMNASGVCKESKGTDLSIEEKFKDNLLRNKEIQT